MQDRCKVKIANPNIILSFEISIPGTRKNPYSGESLFPLFLSPSPKYTVFYDIIRFDRN